MKLDEDEKKALKYALKDFHGDVYLFGSRTETAKRGGDIDILLIPKKRCQTFTSDTGYPEEIFFSV